MRGTLHTDSGCYDLQNAVHIFHNFMISELQDAIVMLGQPSVTGAIRFAVSVLPAIDLDNQSHFPGR